MGVLGVDVMASPGSLITLRDPHPGTTIWSHWQSDKLIKEEPRFLAGQIALVVAHDFTDEDGNWLWVLSGNNYGVIDPAVVEIVNDAPISGTLQT